jgi:glycosyltransferase involved in cell wall biosynthesis
MLRILYIINNRFPDGGAAANRHLTITKGLISLGNKCNIHIIRPTEDKNRTPMNPVKGIYDGVPFRFTSGTNIWKQHNLFMKFILIWLGIIRSIINLIYLRLTRKLDIVISGFDMFSGNIIYSIVCKLLGVKYIYHVDEYPWMIIHPEKFNKIYAFLFVKYFYKLFDGIIVINKRLFEYYSQKKKKDATIYLLPMTVDSSRFKDIEIHQKHTFDIMYVGSMCNYKDGVDILIKAFARFIHENKIRDNVRLLLIGSLEYKKQIEYLKSIAQLNKIEQNVFFLGEKRREEVPKLICNSNVLVLARPASIQAEGGFPTKLGEYLMTKKPVVVTNVGEIHNYLQDGVTAFIADPNENSIANKFKLIYENPDLAMNIGHAGYNVALKYFDYKSQIVALNEYLHSFLRISKYL